MQRRRVAGWRMPPNTIYVGRPNRFANPFPVINRDNATAVANFRQHLDARPDLVADIRDQLAGRNLACWCPLLDAAGRRVLCHADVLLVVANGWGLHDFA